MGGAASVIRRGGRGGIRGATRGIRHWNGFQSVQNEAAALAAVNLFAGFRAQLLENVRENAHAATTALSVAGLGHGRAVVALGNAPVKVAQFFRDRSNEFFPLGDSGFELFPFLRPLCFDLFSFGRDGLLGLFQPGFRDLHATFGFFSGHHNVELAVFGLGNFGLGVGDFMLESSERFVGLYRATLVTVLARAILPLLHFELELLAFGDNLAVGLFCGGNFSAGAAELGIGFANAFRKSFQFSAQSRNLVVNALKLDQVRNRRMHGRPILAQGAAGFARTAAADRMRSFRMQDFGVRSF